MRKYTIALGIITLILSSVSLNAQDDKFKITMMTNWTPQAQFAGYYVAKDKGFFDDAGLDVTILGFSTNSFEDIFSLISKGEIDALTFQLAGAIKNRSAGVPIVNILQTSQSNGIIFISSSPVHYLKDLSNKRIGLWKNDTADMARMALAENKVVFEEIPILQSLSLFYAGAVDAIIAYSFNEYFRVAFRQGEVPEDNIVRLSDLGYDYPEDGLYVTEAYQNAHPKEVKAFADACRKGWEYAASHREEALRITMKYVLDARVFTTSIAQKCMLDEILRLQINPKTGVQDFTPISQNTFNELQNNLIKVKLISRFVNYSELFQ